MFPVESYMSGVEQFEEELCWALNRIALHGESADPRVRYQAKTQATASLEKITQSIQMEENQ